MKFGHLLRASAAAAVERWAPKVRLFQESARSGRAGQTKLGIDYAWEVEHHFSGGVFALLGAGDFPRGRARSAPRKIRLGHGICLMPPKIQSPGAGRGNASPRSISSPTGASNPAPAEERVG